MRDKLIISLLFENRKDPGPLLRTLGPVGQGEACRPNPRTYPVLRLGYTLIPR